MEVFWRVTGTIGWSPKVDKHTKVEILMGLVIAGSALLAGMIGVPQDSTLRAVLSIVAVGGGGLCGLLLALDRLGIYCADRQMKLYGDNNTRKDHMFFDIQEVAVDSRGYPSFHLICANTHLTPIEILSGEFLVELDRSSSTLFKANFNGGPLLVGEMTSEQKVIPAVLDDPSAADRVIQTAVQKPRIRVYFHLDVRGIGSVVVGASGIDRSKMLRESRLVPMGLM